MRKAGYLIYRLRRNMSKKHLLKFYRPLYESNFSYGIIHWGASHHVEPIKILQNKVCRSIPSLNPRTSETEIYHKFGEYGQKFENLYKYRVSLYVFKNETDFQVENNEVYFSRRGGIASAYPQDRESTI